MISHFFKSTKQLQINVNRGECALYSKNMDAKSQLKNVRVSI